MSYPSFLCFCPQDRPVLRRLGVARIALIALLALIGVAVAQPPRVQGQEVEAGDPAGSTAGAGQPSQAAAEPSLELGAQIPVDPRIKTGRLDNGLTYYVRENRRPEKRAELRLAVNVGSILEDEDQRGLAHFVEHMAFNGTRNFKKQELVEYLESIGLRFGPDLNAYTSFDETVYMLQIPTDSSDIVARAFQVLEDWAHGVSFEDEEIQKERGVVIEEWRSGRGASARIQDQQFPVLLKDSLYAERRPIGEKDVLESFEPEVLRRFYRDWYRPDLMAVVAVGDFDGADIEGLIRQHFTRLAAPPEPRPRRVAPVPDHDETLFSIATDPEITTTGIGVVYKYDLPPETKVEDYRRSLVESLYYRMVNDRLAERVREAEPPFLSAFSTEGRFVRSKAAYVLSAGVKEGGVGVGLGAVLTEAERARRHGFSESELGRQKKDLLRNMERIFEEREKTESRVYAAEYLRHFLTGEPIPGIEYELRLTRKYLPGIGLEETNALARRWITDRNRVILLSGPEKPDLVMPDEEALLAVFRTVEGSEIHPYVDRVAQSPLLSTIPEAGEIVSRRRIEELEVTEWKLENGVRVISKPTDFKNDQVLMSSFSPGGHSLVSDEDYIAALTATAVVLQGGLAELDLIQLQKLLTGKVARVSPSIGEITEGISGSASPQDLETLFQLTYLYFTHPRKDETAFKSYQTRMEGQLVNRQAHPQVVYGDALQKLLSQDHFRRRPFTVEVMAEMDLDKSFSVYRDRFADASDFTFFFVGNFKAEVLESLVETYLGTLPDLDRVETGRDVGVDPPPGVVEETVRKGLEAKSQVRIVFTGPFVWSRENRHKLGSLASLLRIRLRETLREDLGGTYGVSVRASTSHYPDSEYVFSISFGCAPENVAELTDAVFEEIRRFKNEDADADDLANVKETQRRGRETDLKTNGFWLSALRQAYYHGEDPTQVLDFDEQVEALTAADIKQAADLYLNEKRYVKAVLLPEAEAGGANPDADASNESQP